MAEAFVRTINPHRVRVSSRPNAESVMRQLPSWIAHYNQVHHPHKALGYRSRVSSLQPTKNLDRVQSFRGCNSFTQLRSRSILKPMTTPIEKSTQACL